MSTARRLLSTAVTLRSEIRPEIPPKRMLGASERHAFRQSGKQRLPSAIPEIEPDRLRQVSLRPRRDRSPSFFDRFRSIVPRIGGCAPLTREWRF